MSPAEDGANPGPTDPGPKIIIGDDHPLVQAALHGALSQILPGVEILAAATLDQVLAAVAFDPASIDLVLLDLSMPGGDGAVQAGFAGLMVIQSDYPAVPVAILSARQEVETIQRAMIYGASGYIPKSLSLPEMGAAIQAILAGERWTPPGLVLDRSVAVKQEEEIARRFASLTPQQMRILSYVVAGKLNKQIAGELDIAEQTVKVHVSTILRKLNVSTRTQAAIMAERLMVGRPSSV